MTVSRPSTLKRLLLAATMLAVPVMAVAPILAVAQPAISVQIEPPVLPVYEQPPIPEPGYIWTPGYWAYDNGEGYFWVPGTWVQPPEVNLLWTPPYWGWADGNYVFHDGYWGPHVGFYGGIDYGFGYGGDGYEGGRWEGGHFAYNRTVNNFGSVNVTNVYESKVTVVNNTHVSFVGGANGVRAQPTPAQVAAEHEHHLQPTAVQSQHMTAAAQNPQFAAKQNGGHPPIAATAHPGQFQGPGVVPARGAAPAGHPEEHPAPAPEPSSAHPEQRSAPAHEPLPARPEARPAPARAPTPARPEERPAPAHEPPAPHPEQRPPAAPQAVTAPPPAQAPHPPAPRQQERKPPEL